MQSSPGIRDDLLSLFPPWSAKILKLKGILCVLNLLSDGSKIALISKVTAIVTVGIDRKDG